ncbi:putative membrane protein YhdT [Dysgonomonas sp. PF1-14]|uniref:hypothetical protein n=1 Tax=unclassified Dysgonomonas TaxID=2630389 RepID=UPI002475F235|nr:MULTISPECIES: hypothetical protein [unclassified Dysgonomonas]MDH6310405.1 putative membrane protein YhdT [Dysgonomonas sp. PF1-14]MDH6340265.1 putative membrane protein YhdT [Dysgonomonas sp. PF1-16]
MKGFVKFSFWFSIASISVNLIAVILAFTFGDSLRFLEGFLFYSCFLTPILNLLIMLACLFEACFNKEDRKQLMINSLLLLLGSPISIIAMFHIIFSSGYRG